MSEAALRVGGALADARSRGIALLDAQLMLARLTARSRTWLIAHDDAPLDPQLVPQWSKWLARRSSGEPLAYLLGEKEFRSLLLQVTPAVLIPRPETELLVDWAEGLMRERPGRRSVIDLGTGSGAIALALKSSDPRLEVVGTDASSAALAVARANVDRLALPIELVETCWWQGMDGRRFDLAVSNPPYVDADDAALDVLRHEPQMALTPGRDGLAALATIIDGAADHLFPGGWLLLEHGFAQAAAVQDRLARAGFQAIETRHDLAGHERVTGGRRPAAP